ncbi:unnamed protein product [Rhodiola kirilowii]
MERETVVVAVTTSEPVKAAGVKEELESGDVEINEKKREKCSCVIDVKCAENDKVDKWEKEEEEMICRICHLSSDQVEIPTTLIQLGCGCKGELGIAHVHCGEAWFKLKGNRTCEICGEAATNITGVEDHQFIEEWEYSVVETIPETPRATGCWQRAAFLQLLDGLLSHRICPSMVFSGQHVLKAEHRI